MLIENQSLKNCLKINHPKKSDHKKYICKLTE